VAGAARRWRRRSRSPASPRERESGPRLGRFDRPRPEPAGLAELGGLDGPAGQMGQIGFGQLIQKQNFKFKFKGYFLLEHKPNSKIQRTLLRHFLIL
jgi:hypothetical protein